MSTEGYVKYSAEHKTAPVMDAPGWAALNDARTRLRRLNLIGSNPSGVGFGNVSIRVTGNEFLITGTATGAPMELGKNEYCLVRSFDLKANHVVSEGPVRASSESMTHGAIYISNPAVNCVIHIHSREIFDGMLRDHYPSTPADAEYGTPEIALAVEKCSAGINSSEGSIVMAGHDEGVIAFGPSVDRALNLILDLNKKYRNKP